MIVGDLGEALEACRVAGLLVGIDRVTCPGCEESWWLPPAPRAAGPQVEWLRRFLVEHGSHVPPSRAVPQRFRLLVDPVPTEAQVRELQARFSDLGVGVSPRRGVGCLSVHRMADHLAGAIVSAVRDVEACGLRAVRVDPEGPGAEPVLEAANLALLLRSLAAEVERIDVIRTLVAP